MRKVIINEKEYEIYNKLEELNLNTYKMISHVASDATKDPIEISLNMIDCLMVESISPEELKCIDMDEMDEILNSVNTDIEFVNPKPSFTHDGIEYKLRGNPKSFSFKAYQIQEISKEMEIHTEYYITKMAAILYSDGKTSVNKREVIFGEHMTADYMLPFLQLLIKKYGK